MQRESDNESEDCGVPLVPVSVSKARGVEYKLRKEINFLSNLRKEYEVNMLEVKKELLDEKILKKEVEEQRKEFLEAVNKARIQWQQEKENLERELNLAREKIAELTGKLNLKDSILKEQNSRARSPSVMPKEERVAAVEAMMEVVSVRNEIAAVALSMRRLNEYNGELKKKIYDLEEENRDLKFEMEKLRTQAISKVQETWELRAEVNDVTSKKQAGKGQRGELKEAKVKGQKEEQRGEVEVLTPEKQIDKELRAEVREVTSKNQTRGELRGELKKAKENEKRVEREGERRDNDSKKSRIDDGREEVKDANRKKQKKDHRENGEKLAVLKRARNKVEEARDPRAINRILGILNLSNVKKVAKDKEVAEGFRSGLRIVSDQVGIF